MHGDTDEAKEVQEKVKRTWQDKYGTDHPMKSQEIIDKVKETKKELYGDPGFVNREKAKETYFNKTGYEMPFQNPEVINKIQETKQEKYGSFLVDNMFEKCIENYGGIGFASEELAEKIRATMSKRYGTNNYILSDDCKQRMMDKYGVPYYCMSSEHNVSSISKINLAFMDLLKENGIGYEPEFTIDRKRYDIKIKDSNVLIEIDPSYTHNSTKVAYLGGKPKEPINFNYHYEKSKLAEENGYQCIHVFDWDNWGKIINLLKQDKEIVYARNLEIKEVSKEDCDKFLNTNHLQGTCQGQLVRHGLFDKDNNLIQIMTFGKPRYNKNCDWELLRLCSIKKIVGGSEKLFKYFIKEYEPKSIVSYCDKSKFTGNIYGKLGFKLKDKGSPRCHWFNIKVNDHITDNLLRQRGFDQLFGTNFGKGTDNKELMRQNNYVEIYDCGQATWIWRKENLNV